MRTTSRAWNRVILASGLLATIAFTAPGARLSAGSREELFFGGDALHVKAGRRLFERETFGGNGRTCATCHSSATGTVSPRDAQRRFARNPGDPLFKGDGSDDGQGGGVARMLTHATVLVNVPLADGVSLAADPAARTALVRRGIPTTLNTPALDPVLMHDGRLPSLDAQAAAAIGAHANATRAPTAKELERIAEFERTREFFGSEKLWRFAITGKPPALPAGRTDSERRGRKFFEDVPVGPGNSKAGACAVCHSGPLLNETNEFIPVPPRRRGGRFQSVLVSELNAIGNPVQEFVFLQPDGSRTSILSPDPAAR